MASYLDEVRYKQKPLFLGKRNNPDFVIFPRLSKEDQEMYASKNLLKKIEKSREQFRQGQYYTLEEVKEMLKKKKSKK